MNSVQNNTQNSSSSAPTQASSTGSPPAGTAVKPGISKEHETVGITPLETISEISSEMEIAKEIERVGVKKIGETIELPPDLKKLGVTPSSAPPVTTTVLPGVALPISDQKVVTGLHMQVADAFRWLAVWCIKKLKKAHLALKTVHGKIIRVKTK